MRGLGTILGTVILCLSSAILGAWIFDRFFHQASPALSGDLVGNPGMDAVEKYQCPRHLKKSVQIMGVEDGYDRTNDEPARYHEALKFSPKYMQWINNDLGSLSPRHYDQTGKDKFLFDHVTIPHNVEKAQVFFRLRALPGNRNDKFGLLIPSRISANEYDFENIFYADELITEFDIITESRSTKDMVISAPIDELTKAPYSSETSNLPIYLKQQNRDVEAIVTLGDDYQVDFGAIVFCKGIDQIRGTTFQERDLYFLAEGRSFLTCSPSLSHPTCDPHRGDYSCSASLPLACYKTGSKSYEGFIEPKYKSLFSADYFAGGEVKITDPVPGDRFKSRQDAINYCQEKFGQNWRPLSFHESGQSNIATWSDIADRTRVWIDVYTVPNGNCWSADVTESPRD